MKPKTQYWIELSEYDLETALTLLEGGKFLYVAFMCHQCIEKALKAYLTEISEDAVPYTHSLSHLLSKCGLEERLTKDQLDFLDRLEPMNIEARYPTYKEKLFQLLTKDFCITLTEETRKLQEWIRLLL